MLLDVLLTAEEKALKNEVRDFVKNEVSTELIRKMDRDEITYPREYVKKLGEKNLLGLRFPKKYGGRGLNWTGEIAALEEIGVLGTALGCAFAMPSIVGEALNRFGTDDQKENFLKPLLKGDLVSAEALTEPRGGSDFFGATTRADLKNGTFTIKGQKRFVVAADGADFFIVYCNTNPQGKPHERISLILIEKDRPGVEVKYLYKLLGTRGGGTGRLIFRDVKVPESNLIGGLNQGANIFNSMMVPERLTSAGASLGMGRAALEVAIRYSDRRKAFGQKIRNFQGVSFKAADAIAQLDSARALTIAAGKAVDTGMSTARRLVSEAKKVATDAAWNIINLSMQIVGGIGYTNVYPIEKLLRDARLIQIWTGTNEIMNLLIQHEFYREVLGDSSPARLIEADAEEAGAADEKVYIDEDMWTKGW
ncbi:MAG: acyl-CoA/acyl-ACP dehydrogenase [Syntrophales bacterium]|nr:acyl-CoA/acyl-ACP dehydrogenase [Syntrophales bacterium]MDD5533438.1 acyl-CoA/acyl-ACP dehydrogenase [Syntrophales bacterium]HPL62258.1 acyl-CoA dehydrogenase family protein [Syntrophales bacterium]